MNRKLIDFLSLNRFFSNYGVEKLLRQEINTTILKYAKNHSFYDDFMMLIEISMLTFTQTNYIYLLKCYILT